MNARCLKLGSLVLVMSILPFATGCVQPPPPPEALACPEPILDNSGEYMSPYTQDDVLAMWVDSAIKAKMAAGIGATVGNFIGQKLFEQIPFVGGIIGQKIGRAAAKAIAIKYAGGEENIKNTSDISFNDLDTMAVFLYVKYSKTEHYKDAFSATCEIYPDLKTKYWSAIKAAPRRPGYVPKKR